MNESNILKWAAGINCNLPQFDEIDESRLISLIQQHHLAPRFLYRFQLERPGWCSKTLLADVLAACSQLQKMTKRQIEALHEIIHAMGPHGNPLITIKGFSTYALTNDANCMRFSGDLDVLFYDLEYLWETMRRLGYHGEKRLEWQHEFAVLLRDGIMFELHRFFPVVAYPKGLLDFDHLPTRNPGCWVQPFTDRTQSEIRYYDLVANSQRGLSPETTAIAVPDPTLAVMIFCVHALRHFMEPPCHWALPVNLGELIDINQLVHHPRFDRQRFIQLTEKFNAYDSVLFVGYLLQTYFGSHPFSISSPSSWKELEFSFPRSLTWFGGWASLTSVDDLLLPIDMRTIIDRLVANTIVATKDDSHYVYSFSIDEKGKAIDRAIVQNIRDAHIPFTFSVTWQAEVLCFEISIFEPTTNDYRIQIIGPAPKAIYSAVIEQQGTQLNQEGNGHAKLFTNEKGYRVDIQLPIILQQGDTVSILLCVMEHDTSDTANPLVIMPLHIVLE